MGKEINLENLTRIWPELDADSLKILQRKRVDGRKVFAFSIYMALGLGFGIWGFTTLLEAKADSPEASVAWSVVSFALAIIGFGFAFFGFVRDKEIENVTAGIYLLLRVSINGQGLVMPSENSPDDIPEHGPWCKCHCTVVDLKTERNQSL